MEGPFTASEKAVRFQDVDAAGFVFFARFFDYFHDSWVELLESVGQPLTGFLPGSGTMAPLVGAEARYLGPLRFGDRYRATIERVDVDRSKVLLHHRIACGAATVATGTTVHMWIDDTRQRAPLPPALFDALSRIGPAGHDGGNSGSLEGR